MDRADRQFLASFVTPSIPHWLGEEIWDMLEARAGVEHDRLLKEDLLYGLEHACRNEVYGEWRGMSYEADLWYNQGLRFEVRAKGERAQERRARFAPLEEEVNRELRRLVPVYRPYELAADSEKRLRPSGLACV